MADMYQIESDKKNWAKTVDDALNSADTYWTDWSQDGVVLVNGFQNAAPNDPNSCLRWRNLVRKNGQIVFSEVSGTINHSGLWEGDRQTAFKLPHSVQFSHPAMIGSVVPANNGSVFEGALSIYVNGNTDPWEMSLAGKRVDGASDNLDGWILIDFLSN